MSKPTEQDIEEQLETFEKLFEIFPVEVRDQLATELPTEPGVYQDQDGAEWTLSESGNWYDHHGVTFDTKFNFVLPLLGADIYKSEEV